MVAWQDVVRDAPELAQTVRERFGVGKHATLATLRRDGGPRISGTEVEFADDDVWLGSMPGAVKALDLRRDPRLALHSPSVDPPEDDPSGWLGEAKMSGRAIEVSDSAALDQPHRFRVDVTEVVFTRVAPSGDHLLIESWHEGRGPRRQQRW